MIVAREIDPKNNGIITRSEFVRWYAGSEARIRSKIREVFNKFDYNQVCERGGGAR